MQTCPVQQNDHVIQSASRPARNWVGVTCCVVLLVGLSGCSPSQPDPIGHLASAPPSNPPVTATSNHQNHPFNSDARTLLQPTPPPPPERATAGTRPQSQAAPEAARSAPNDTDPTVAARQQWFAEARTNPDVAIRRQALELWAEQPSQGLDPLSYALVDEDESVRTRAQELYEQQLAREATAAQQAAPSGAGDVNHPSPAE